MKVIFKPSIYFEFIILLIIIFPQEAFAQSLGDRKYTVSSIDTRLLDDSDLLKIEKLISGQREKNIFIVKNLEKLKEPQDLVTYWGQFNALGELVGILMRYHKLWYLYCSPETDLSRFVEIIDSDNEAEIIVNDNLESGEKLLTIFKNYNIEQRIRGRLLILFQNSSMNIPTKTDVKRATLKDLHLISAFYSEAPSDVRRGSDSIKRSITSGRRTYFISKSDSVQACALTTAELQDLAMIGGIHASSLSEKNEYLLSVIITLIKSLTSENKKICIVVRDPIIENLCKKIGFQDLGRWDMLLMKRKQIKNIPRLK